MKRLATILLGLMLASCSLGYYSTSTGVITTANLSLQPAWGPAGYDCAHYYYFPDYNFYYDVDNALFYYLSGSRWISARQLPYSLGYPRDLYKFYKVVLNIRDPWKHNRAHRREYKHFCGIHNQPVLHDRRPQNRPPQDRPPQERPQQVRPNQQPQPQGRPNNGYSSGTDYRNTVRNSRNNNTSRNNIAPQQGSSSRNNTTTQPSQSARPSQNTKPSQSARPSQGTKPKQGAQTTGGSRNNNTSVGSSRNNSKSSQTTQSKSSSSSRSTTTNKSNSSGGSRSTGSRGR